MDCVQARVAMSAELDGEPSGAAEQLQHAHVKRCADCRLWREQAIVVTRRLRLSSATPTPDLYEQIVLSARPQAVWLWVARLRVAALLLCAAAQLAINIPDLAGNVMPGMEGMADHRMHEIAVFGLALAIAFIAGAIRPRLAPGLAWVAGAAAFGLLMTALSDIIGNRTFGGHEAQHLVAIFGALLLAWTASEQRDPKPGPSHLRLRSTNRATPTNERWSDEQGDAA